MDYSYVNDFRKLGFGMFVHFGLYSVLGKGEWHFQYTRDSRMSDEVAMERYIEKTFPRFKVAPNWAKELCKTAKKAGCRYVTLTTRHHEGFSLYDTCGLNELDAPHRNSSTPAVNMTVSPFSTITSSIGGKRISKVGISKLILLI